MAVAPRLLTLLLAVAAVLHQVASAPPSVRASASSSYRCGWCPRRSTASLLPLDGAGVLNGAACGYGPASTAPEHADPRFHIAAVSAGFFRDGEACGACYQLRCRGRTACEEDGVKVVVVGDVADAGTTNGTASRFLLSKDAFETMTSGGDRLASLDATVDVDFRRIPCVYRHKNLALKVEETSVRSRGHLAIRFLYQGGQTDIAAVEIWNRL